MTAKKKRKEKNVVFVATNIIASRPSKRRPTGTPHANTILKGLMKQPPRQGTYGALNINTLRTKLLCSVTILEPSLTHFADTLKLVSS